MIANRPPDQRADAQRQPHAFKKRHRGVAAVAEIDEDRRQHRRREDHQQDAGDALYGGKAPAWLVKRHAALGQRGPHLQQRKADLEKLFDIVDFLLVDDEQDHMVLGLDHGIVMRNDDSSEEHTSELQSLMRISYAVFCLKKKSSTTEKLKSTTKTTE